MPYVTFLLFAALAWAAVSFSTAPLHAAGFDCSRAETDVERRICADDELSRLDEKLNSAYKKALARAGSAVDKEALRVVQRAWIKQRDACADEECLRALYTTRLKALEMKAAEETSASPPATAPTPPKATLPKGAQPESSVPKDPSLKEASKAEPIARVESSKAAPGWALRQRWYERLRWPAACEADFREQFSDTSLLASEGLLTGKEDAGPGVAIHALGANERLALIQCGQAAYQTPFVLMLFEADSDKPGRLLSLKRYERQTSGQVDVSESSDITGEPFFNPKDKTLTVMTKSRGIGDCGSLVVYGFVQGQAVVKEARAQACFDDEKQWVTDPKRWPKVETP